jgi:hypothetical protein
MIKPTNSLLGVSLALAVTGTVLAMVGCGDKITNIYIIEPDAAIDGQSPGTPPATDGAVAETSGEAGPASDGGAGAGGGDAVSMPMPPAADGGPPPAAYTGKPWNGMPQVIPGTLQFEFYDLGGEGVAFHDTDAANQGSGVQNAGMNKPEAMFRRMEGVDISYTKAGTDRLMGGMNVPVDQLYVGWTAAGEWLKYTINVAETGNYMLSMFTSANGSGSTISFTFEDGSTTGALPIPVTGSWNVWEHVDNMAIVKLAAGTHVMTVRIEAQGNNNLDYLIFTKKP